MIVDYHMHLRGPSEGPEGPIDHSVEAVERFVEAAAAAGVDEIGFTEHDYYFVQLRDLWDLPYQAERCTEDLDRYCDAVLEAKRRGLPVKLALEIDYVAGRFGELRELLAPYPWDYLLGSVHWLDGLAIDQEPGLWGVASVEDVWRRYFHALAELAASGLVEVLAHPDLAKIFGRRPSPEAVAELHESLALAAAEAAVAVEVSTAGLRKQVGELYPDRELLERCRAHGVPVTIASDAHVPQFVGWRFDAALELLRETGYETVSVYDTRIGRQVPLG